MRLTCRCQASSPRVTAMRFVLLPWPEGDWRYSRHLSSATIYVRDDCSSFSRTSRSSQWAFSRCTLTGSTCPARFAHSSIFSVATSALHRIGSVSDRRGKRGQTQGRNLRLADAQHHFARTTGSRGGGDGFAHLVQPECLRYLGLERTPGHQALNRSQYTE